MKYEKEAKIFVNAIQEIAKNPENIDNLEIYLSNHFKTWMEKYANTPEELAYELKQFAEMGI